MLQGWRLERGGAQRYPATSSGAGAEPRGSWRSCASQLQVLPPTDNETASGGSFEAPPPPQPSRLRR